MPGDKRRWIVDESWVFCILNVALSAAFTLIYVEARSQYIPIIQGFDVELKTLSVWLLSPMSILIVPVLGVASFVNELVLQNKRKRLVTNLVLLFVLLVIAGLFVVALALPLIMPLRDLS
ncbi:MAG: hypothetical protein HZA46_23460 [Planctomycetales bacterium]|nr:hypothetical protein [Planctomycetales bacterium]